MHWHGIEQRCHGSGWGSDGLAEHTAFVQAGQWDRSFPDKRSKLSHRIKLLFFICLATCCVQPGNSFRNQFDCVRWRAYQELFTSLSDIYLPVYWYRSVAPFKEDNANPKRNFIYNGFSFIYKTTTYLNATWPAKWSTQWHAWYTMDFVWFNCSGAACFFPFTWALIEIEIATTENRNLRKW